MDRKLFHEVIMCNSIALATENFFGQNGMGFVFASGQTRSMVS
jgi:hypothetical protein